MKYLRTKLYVGQTFHIYEYNMFIVFWIGITIGTVGIIQMLHVTQSITWLIYSNWKYVISTQKSKKSFLITWYLCILPYSAYLDNEKLL